jgi:ComF family protein
MRIEADETVAAPAETAILARTGALFRASAGGLVDLLLPPRCAACGGPVTAPGLCGPCWAKVDFVAPPYCQRLGTPFPYDAGEALISPAALADPPDYDRARTVARYDGPARALVHALKFNDRLEMAGVLAVQMARAGAELIGDCDVVVPVPLHRGRLFSRRFNQSALLAERIARLSARDYAPAAIVRAKRTRHQIGLSAAERHRNVAGAFKVPAETRPLIEGRRVLLVDDVMTTGATVNACARICRRAGASGIDVLTFARVVAPS